MLVDPDKLVGIRTYCRETRRLFWIQETELVRENEETGQILCTKVLDCTKYGADGSSFMMPG
jgi:hypothetical protein